MIARTPRDLGAVVKDARLSHSWTQAELARRVGVSRQWLIALERGKKSAEVHLVLRTLAELGLALDVVAAPPRHGGVDLDQLLDDHDVRSEP